MQLPRFHILPSSATSLAITNVITHTPLPLIRQHVQLYLITGLITRTLHCTAPRCTPVV